MSVARKPFPNAAPVRPALSELSAALAPFIDDELDPAFRRRVATVMEWLPPSADDDAWIVDIGCGRGFFLHYYAQLGQAVALGIERDADAAQRAARALAQRPRIGVVRGDVQALPLPTESCAGAILSEVLEHVEDDAAVLSEAFRVLRPGGVLALTVPNSRYPFAWDPINRTLSALGVSPIRRGPLAGIWAGHVRLYEIGALRALVQRAGFVVEDERAIVRRCLPFSHNLLYGLGKALLDAGLVPASIAAVVDRHRTSSTRPSHAARALRALLSYGDRGNRAHEGFDVPSVNLALKLRRLR